MIHLDTSFLIRMLEPRSPEARFVETADSDELMLVSAVAWAEFLCGPLTPDDKDLALAALDGQRDCTVGDAAVAARLFNVSGRRRGSLPDCLIAAAAMQDGARLATANPRDFRRFEASGLTLI